MKIANLPDDNYKWIDDAKSYWNGVIDSGLYENKDELKEKASQYIDELRTKFDDYKGTSIPSIFYRSLNEFFGYCTMKIRMVVDDDPGVTEIIPDDDIRNLFTAWKLDAIEFSAMFTIEGETTGDLQTTPEYDDFKSSLESAASSDASALSSFEMGLGSAMGAKSTYLTYGRPKVTMIEPENPDWTKEYVYNDMHLKDVLDFFGWKVKGVNI